MCIKNERCVSSFVRENTTPRTGIRFLISLKGHHEILTTNYIVVL